MGQAEKITSLSELLDSIEKNTSDKEEVTLTDIVDAIGSRSFGPMLLVPGVVMVVPGVGDIPGVTTIMAIVVFLIAGQLFFRRKHLWLPKWLLNRSVKQERIEKGISWVRKPARFVDRLLRHRLDSLVSGRAIAVGCLCVAGIMPLMEIVPFGGMVVGTALTAFGLALVASDGLLALLAYLATAASVGGGLYYLLAS